MRRCGVMSSTRLVAVMVMAATAIALVACGGNGEEAEVNVPVTTRQDGADPTVAESPDDTLKAPSETSETIDSIPSGKGHGESAVDVELGVVLGPLTDKEPGSGPPEELRPEFSSAAVNRSGLSRVAFRMGSSGWSRLLELPAGGSVPVSWTAWEHGITAASSCRFTLRVKDDEGQLVEPDYPERYTLDACGSQDEMELTMKDPGEYTLFMTLDFPGDAPSLSVEQPFRVVDF